METKRNLIKWPDLVIGLAFVLFLIWCFTGCKAVEKYKASPQYAQDCADDFPNDTATVLLPGKIIEKVDTMYEHEIIVDTVYSPFETIIYRDKVKTKVKTLHRTDTLVKVVNDSARIYYLNALLSEEKDQRQKVEWDLDRIKAQRNVYLYAWIIALVFFLLWAYNKIRNRK